MKKFIEKLNLKDLGVEITRGSAEDNQYSIHKLSNLLNANKTKYRCEILPKEWNEPKEPQFEKDSMTGNIFEASEKDPLAETRADKERAIWKQPKSNPDNIDDLVLESKN